MVIRQRWFERLTQALLRDAETEHICMELFRILDQDGDNYLVLRPSTLVS